MTDDIQQLDKQLQDDQARISDAHDQAAREREKASQRQGVGNDGSAQVHALAAVKLEQKAREHQKHMEQVTEQRQRNERELQELLDRRTRMVNEHHDELVRIDAEITRLGGNP